MPKRVLPYEQQTREHMGKAGCTNGRERKRKHQQRTTTTGMIRTLVGFKAAADVTLCKLLTCDMLAGLRHRHAEQTYRPVMFMFWYPAVHQFKTTCPRRAKNSHVVEASASGAMAGLSESHLGALASSASTGSSRPWQQFYNSIASRDQTTYFTSLHGSN